MNQAKQIQQLSADGVAIKEIVRHTGISRKTVRKYLRKIEAIDHVLQVSASPSLPDNELAAIIYQKSIFFKNQIVSKLKSLQTQY